MIPYNQIFFSSSLRPTSAQRKPLQGRAGNCGCALWPARSAGGRGETLKVTCLVNWLLGSPFQTGPDFLDRVGKLGRITTRRCERQQLYQIWIAAKHKTSPSKSAPRIAQAHGPSRVQYSELLQTCFACFGRGRPPRLRRPRLEHRVAPNNKFPYPLTAINYYVALFVLRKAQSAWTDPRNSLCQFACFTARTNRQRHLRG